MKWLSLLLSLWLLCPLAFADTYSVTDTAVLYSVTDEQLDAILEQTAVLENQVQTLSQLLTEQTNDLKQVSTQLQQEQVRAKRYKALSLVLGGALVASVIVIVSK